VNVDRADSGNLDLLRSFAVLCVLVFHLLLFFGQGRVPHGLGSLGHWGVLVFFVHTSIVLMASIERQLRRGGGGAVFGEFLVRRAFRLLPLAWVTIAAIVALRLPVGHLENGRFVAVSTSPLAVAENLMLVQNLGGAESLEAPLWSLPYEMQMYLLLPAMFWLVRRSRTPLAIGALWLAVTVVAKLRFHEAETDLLDYAPCFLAGITGYAIARTRRGTWHLRFWVWPVVIAAATAFYVARPTVPHGWVSCLAIAIAVVAIRELPDGSWRVLCQLIARYSYGVYLAHFLLIWLAFDHLGEAPWSVQIAVFALLLVALPVALYHLVERPMIRVGERVALALRRPEVCVQGK
jgi:peptidoglycan/LPS O-acetylase OafA/YrhL